MLGTLSDFIKTWEKEEADQRKIHLLSIRDENDRVYAIEIRYSATLFHCVDDKHFTPHYTPFTGCNFPLLVHNGLYHIYGGRRRNEGIAYAPSYRTNLII